MKEDRPCRPLAVVGAGAAGLSAALWAARLGWMPAVFEAADRPGGQLQAVHQPVIDYLGLPVRDGPELIRHFLAHLRQAGVSIALGVPIAGILPRTEPRPHFLLVPGRKTGPPDAGAPASTDRKNGGASVLCARAVILATGTRPRRLGVPGEALIAESAWSSTSRNAERFRGRAVVIVGGGDRAVEGALNVAPHAAVVTLLVRGAALKARSALRQKLPSHRNIRIFYRTVIRRIEASGGSGPRYRLLLAASDAPPSEAGAGRTVESLPPVLIADDVLLRIGMEPVLPPIWTEASEPGRAQAEDVFWAADEAMPEKTVPEGIWIAGDAALPASERSVAAAVGSGMQAAKRAVLWLEAQEILSEADAPEAGG
ncbi:NAD(P)/FAD-dependent oxidoreductase [Hydrogenibacillus schlegelii]|uniref:FAD/NAD(P)-binding domain-containing protein n=2 Tax=Hydrogenibacillus schlegelii TaxID=1484 RepID=A0A132N8Q5_HYDSH|nr:NAD(P)/FAD-dependent oxidoreductase [Hydrogenibacillus schlegelii]KWX05922.1 hypothetical protein TR75_07405 [Hydrogenibacillus schlegelii]OAR04886.1 hypothetical protein SA87_09800 [Hydrogenibacillus schlegelii]